MGHLGHLKTEYRELLQRLDAGQVGLPEPADPEAWKGWKEILEIMYTPEDASLAARMPVKPASLEALAARLGMEVPALLPRLNAMCDRGLVMDIVNPRTGKTRYMLAPPVVGFFEFSLMRIKDGIPKKRMAEALHAYTLGDRAFVDEVFGGETMIGRALVREDELDVGVMPEVLGWERATALIEQSDKLAVSFCYCRHKAEHLGHDCDAPKEICLSMGVGAEFVARREFGRAIDRVEGLELLHQAKQAGLVQIADNVQSRPTYICNCCGCCCGQLQAINIFDLPAVNPSGFQPGVDETKCAGCSRCSRACPITAISMTAKRLEAQRRNTLVPSVDTDRCIGCGVCAEACRKGAMKMHRRAVQSYVPKNAIERSIRMTLERGRLADLIFDEGQSRGHRFLNSVVTTLSQLPLAERVLASEQVRSRFVRQALKMVSDPTG